MREEKLTVEGITFIVHYYDESESQLILEAKTKGIPLGGDYSYKKHSPHIPGGDYHIHGYENQKEIFAINKSGTAHDGYHGVVIPKKAFDALSAKFPDWNWPANRLIESLTQVRFYDDSLGNRLRPVFVQKYKDHVHLNEGGGYNGFFHGYAECPFLTGGNGGWINRTMAIIEDTGGNLHTVPISSVVFRDLK
jgi:hypothetical protein